MDVSEDLMERFWSRVDITGGVHACWLWRGPKRAGGYGVYTNNGLTTGAHRWAYEDYVGPIPEGWSVCHHCDNPPCVNPSHLFVGTSFDNARDRDAKGRTYRVYRWTY